MLIKFRCPHCQAVLEAGINLAGKKGSCPKCNKTIMVPKNESDAKTEPKETVKKGLS